MCVCVCCCGQDPHEVERAIAEANLFSLASHHFWGVWAVLQARWSKVGQRWAVKDGSKTNRHGCSRARHPARRPCTRRPLLVAFTQPEHDT